MPFIKRLVALDERSGRCGLPQRRSGSRRRRDYHSAVEIAAGDGLVRVCRLLACLAQHADDLFEDLLDECRRVADRTKLLDDRLRGGLADRVAQLDAKTAARRECTAILISYYYYYYYYYLMYYFTSATLGNLDEFRHSVCLKDDGTGDGTLHTCEWASPERNYDGGAGEDYRIGTLSKINNIMYCKNDCLRSTT